MVSRLYSFLNAKLSDHGQIELICEIVRAYRHALDIQYLQLELFWTRGVQVP